MNKIDKIKQVRHWVEVVNITMEVWEEYNRPSVRKLSDILGLSRGWTERTLRIGAGLRAYPELEKLSSRNAAYNFLVSKGKKRL